MAWLQLVINEMLQRIFHGRLSMVKMALLSLYVLRKVRWFAGGLLESRDRRFLRATSLSDLWNVDSCVSGSVEAFSSLDCEVVFYPSFGSSKTTQFALHVEGGNQPKLLCQAQVNKFCSS